MSLSNAAADIRYLLDSGYPQKGAISFVCNHYRLDENARHLFSRSIIPCSVSEKRRSKFLPCNMIRDNRLMIDGYNIIIGMESILEKRAILCDDGIIRDTKGISRKFRASEHTNKANEFIFSYLKGKNPLFVCFLLDSQISNSGILAESLRERIDHYGLKGDARTSRHVDHDLKVSHDIVATGDGVIIDAAKRVVNFLYCMMCEFPDIRSGVSEIGDLETRIK